MLDQAIGRLTSEVGDMAAGMIRLGKRAESEAVRLQAQRSVITHLHDLIDHAEIKARLQKIECQLEELERSKHANRFG